MDVWTYIAVGAGIMTGLVGLISTIKMCIKAKKTFKETKLEVTENE